MATPNATKGASDGSTALELDVADMTCAACVRRVEKALRGAEGVRDAHVNLATQRATVLVDGDLGTRATQLAAAVERAGYRVLGSSADQAISAADGVAGASETRSSPAAQRLAAREALEEHERRSLNRDLVLAASLTVPLVALAMSHGAWEFAASEAGRWLQFALATPVVFGPGARFLRLAWKATRAKSADMNTLVALGVLAAWLQSSFGLIAPHVFRVVAAHGNVHTSPHLYFEAAATIVTFVLLGKKLETRARHHLGDAVRGLHALVPARARRRAGAIEVEVDVARLVVGDEVIVRPGERVPADGVVIEGASAVDEALLSGESLPVEKAAGASVVGGAIVTSGALVVRVTRTGADTALARIVAAVEAAQGSRAPIARLADRVSAVFVPVVLALALATFGVWLASGAGFGAAMEHAVAVLVIACPCALGLATPAAIAVGTGRAAELGVLFRGGAAIERAAHVDTVVLDKTGTLTNGAPVLTEVVATSEFEGMDVLLAAAALESASEHPLARALVAGARERGLAVDARVVEGFRTQAGAGVSGTFEGRRVVAGSAAWLVSNGVDVAALATRADALAAGGASVVFVAVDARLAGLVALADEPAEGARATVETLRARGLRVVMASGDRSGTARAIAARVGVLADDVHGELVPEAKAQLVERLRSSGARVAMVGDGVNDAPALAAADVGIAMGHGTDVAAAAADVTLLRGGIAALPRALALARATLATIRRNLVWAFVYNVVGIPLAAGVFVPLTGWSLSPMFASAAMSLSSVSVLASSLWLRRFERESAPK